jgi:hypothetical protein
MNKSESIAAISAALAKAQSSFKPAVKDSANPFFKSSFLSLSGVIDAVRDALTSNGIAITQLTGMDGDKLILNSMLIHSSGEYIGCSYPIKSVKDDPQSIGSACSYARRYSLMALVGIAAEDDDGEAASGRTAAPAKAASVTGAIATKKPAWTPEQSKLVGEHFAEIIRIGGDTGEAEIKKLRSTMAYDAPTDVVDAAAKLMAKWRDVEADNQNNQG